MTAVPEVSIIIPTRDRPSLLPRTLATALGQLETRAEIIIVDDGSRDPVEAWLADAARESVRVFRHPRAMGVARARNVGIAEARGEWLAFLDDDDLWAPSKLSEQLAAVRAGGDFAYAGSIAVDASGTVLWSEEPPPVSDLHRRLLRYNAVPCCCSNLIVRAELVRELGGFDATLDRLADWDMALRCSAVGTPARVNQRLVAYLIHPAGMHTSEAGHEDELSTFAEKHHSARIRQGVELDRAGWLRWRVRGARFGGDYSTAARTRRELARLTGDPRDRARALAGRLGGERLARPAWWPGRREQPPDWLRRALAPATSESLALGR